MEKDDKDSARFQKFRSALENAKNYGEVWNVVKESVEFSLHKRRSGMMLFLDDLPIQLGAYHTLGTNNIVLNRVLVQIVETTLKSDRIVNAMVYNLLVHEYLHALGKYPEPEVRRLVVTIARKCFGDNYVVTMIAESSPWAMLRGIPLDAANAQRQAMEIVKDFEKTDKYIV